MALLLAVVLACAAFSGAGQAWAMGRRAPRSGPNVLAWIASSIAQLAVYSYPIDDLRTIPLDMLAVIVIAAMAVPAAAFWVGARKARVPAGEPWLGRLFAVLPIHLVIMFVGSLAGWVLLDLVGLRHIH